ncbi:ankyrin repeat domain-containing protein [Kribbella sp.]|uniref:ankyrin repeat domain-containing protein n=1 Tax=Kribbella sp. TaxID=1871183 RepID=UPI002D588C35|nr:ankyrin repeat domain-containing protein [Kribbella sp.]HZX06763.1 ankyrin repeat domain-containing protein [Kribbella sp.]
MPSGLDNQLIAAAWKNDVPEAKRLIAAGADVNALDDTVQSAFLIAASEGYLDLLNVTLAHGADVRSLDSYHGTALIRAAERGHAAVVGRLLQAGVAVDHVNNLGWTALHEAVLLGKGTPQYVDTVRLLIAGGADRNKPAVNDGTTPVQAAKTRGQTAVSAALADGHQASGLQDGRAAADALLAAASSGDADKVAAALAAGAPIESRDDRRRTALLLASLNDRVDAARLLVQLGADPDAQDDRKDSAWLVTGVTGSVAMLETLLPANPDLTLRNRFGGISVIPASERGHVDYVRRVVKTKIDVNHVNDLGWTALLEAIILGKGTKPWQDIVQILVDAGADPSLADKDGVTPLRHAESSGYDEIARILRAAGAR